MPSLPPVAPEGDDRYMSAADVAAYLSLSTNTVWRFTRHEGLQAHYLTVRNPRYLKSEVDAWVAERARKNAPAS